MKDKNASQPLVSIVTPVYNGEKYLAECIESVLRQTYENWEYLIADNCSTDRSLEIARQYAARDSRLHVFENSEFVPAIENWNRALRHISQKSKYSKEIHADDMLLPECIERMVATAEAHPTAGVVSSYRLDDLHVNCDGLPLGVTFLPGKEICRRTLLRQLFLFGSGSTPLIRADLIRKRAAFYNTENIHADTEACFDVLQESDFAFVHQVLTFTRRHAETGTSFARQYNTYLLGWLISLLKYGPVHLSKEEYKMCLQRHLGRYYQFLGRQLLLGKFKVIFYHKKGMLERRLSFNLSRLALGALQTLMKAAICPSGTLRWVRDYRSRRKDRERESFIEGWHND
jgi:glycosyltransferase involved in cell wall biosynthesis